MIKYSLCRLKKIYYAKNELIDGKKPQVMVLKQYRDSGTVIVRMPSSITQKVPEDAIVQNTIITITHPHYHRYMQNNPVVEHQLQRDLEYRRLTKKDEPVKYAPLPPLVDTSIEDRLEDLEKKIDKLLSLWIE